MLELQSAVSPLMRGLGTERGSFKGTTEPPLSGQEKTVQLQDVIPVVVHKVKDDLFKAS